MNNVKVYLKAKTFDELIVKQQMMNTLSGREYQYTESYFAKSFFYVTFKADVNRWNDISKMIDGRLKAIAEKASK
tara:strand:- start:351 stop:575 length:225 start_codon:yes stop_codon:yes gene_type:complete